MQEHDLLRELRKQSFVWPGADPRGPHVADVESLWLDSQSRPGHVLACARVRVIQGGRPDRTETWRMSLDGVQGSPPPQVAGFLADVWAANLTERWALEKSQSPPNAQAATG